MLSGKRIVILVTAALVAVLAIPLTRSGPSAEAQDQVTVRPIEDFLAMQGTWAGFPNFINWVDNEETKRVRVDYAGLLNWYIEDRSDGAISLGTEMSGIVSEKAMPDGRTEVHVILHTTNALTFVRDLTQPGAPFLFGQPAPPIVFGGRTASLGSSHWNVTYLTPNPPGAPLADLFRLMLAPEEGEEFVQVLFDASAEGQLRSAFGVPEGTPGRVSVTQKGIFNANFEGDIMDASAFPASRIELRVTGQ